MLYDGPDYYDHNKLVLWGAGISRVDTNAEPEIIGHTPAWIDVDTLLDNCDEPVKLLLTALIQETQELRDAAKGHGLKERL